MFYILATLDFASAICGMSVISLKTCKSKLLLRYCFPNGDEFSNEVFSLHVCLFGQFTTNWLWHEYCLLFFKLRPRLSFPLSQFVAVVFCKIILLHDKVSKPSSYMNLAADNKVWLMKVKFNISWTSAKNYTLIYYKKNAINFLHVYFI